MNMNNKLNKDADNTYPHVEEDTEIIVGSTNEETNGKQEKSKIRLTIADYRRIYPVTADELRRRSISMQGKNVGRFPVRCSITGASIGSVSMDHEFVKNRTWISFNAGRVLSEETKAKISKRMKEIPSNLPSDTFKDRRWWNNGLVNKRTLTKPEGDGWVPGQLKAWQKKTKKVWGTSVIEV